MLAGEHDTITRPGRVRELANAIPGAGFTEVDDAGHLVNLENLAAFNQAVEEVLAGRMSR